LRAGRWALVLPVVRCEPGATHGVGSWEMWGLVDNVALIVKR
jgi:hypothetical protein